MAEVTVRNLHSFPGGIHPPENKAQSLAKPIRALPLPEFLILPLSMHVGAPAVPVVAVGDRVLRGEMVARSDGPFSAAVHASSSGRIAAIEQRPVPHVSGISAPAIVIEVDGDDRSIEMRATGDFRSLDPIALVELLRDAGVAGLGGAGFPTAVKLRPRHRIDTLILNGTECEPYITADHALMRERPEQVIAGALVLAHALGNPDQLLIGIEDNKPDARQALEEAATGTRIEVVEFPTKYPSGGEKQLLQILTGRQVPHGGLPADVGVVVQNVGTAAACWHAVERGMPLTSRITTAVGEALATSGNFDVRIGTPVAHLLRHCGLDEERCERVIMGGPMMGFTLPALDVPVTKITNCVMAPARGELRPTGPEQPCIRCGMCAEACPASLLPQQLFWYARSAEHDRLKDYNLFDCIECGACAYVCPSQIPLVQYYRAAKGEIREKAREKVKADRARERFESRKARLEQEQQERERRRQEKLAARAGTDNPPDPARSAMQRAAANAVQQDTQRSVRQAATLRERLASLRDELEKLDPAQDSGPLRSRIADTERKLASLEPDEAGAANPPAPDSDRAAAAIERARQRAAEAAKRDPREQLRGTIESLHKKIATTAAKLADARSEGSDAVSALESAADKLQQRLEAAQRELQALDELEENA